MTKEEIIELYKNDSRFVFSKELRKNCLEIIEKSNFPTKKDENWKYTDISAILQHKYSKPEPVKIHRYSPVMQIAEHEELADNVVVICNNRLDGDASRRSEIRDNLDIDEMCGYRILNEEIAEKYLNKSQIHSRNIFTAINTAFCESAVLVYIPDNKTIEKPIRLMQLISSVENPCIINPRILIVVGKNSKVSFFQDYKTMQVAKIEFVTDPEKPYLTKGIPVNTEPQPSFTNTVIEIYAEENSSVEFNVNVETASFSPVLNSIHIELQQNVQFTGNLFSLDSGFIRNDVYMDLQGENINAELNGLYIAKSQNIHDNFTFVNHAKAHCQSRQVFKSIIADKARGVYHGRVYVAKDAQKTDAYQSSRNVLLSKEANATSKPQLEIYADDVKCSHGCTTGQIDDQAVFYMQARGIGKEQAKALLLQSYTNDITSQIKNEKVKELIEKKVEQIFEKGINQHKTSEV